MRAVVPVRDGDGTVVALVVGRHHHRRDRPAAARRLLPIVLLAALVVLAAGLLGAWLISRRLRRQTHGLGAARDHPDVRVLRRGAARRPRGTAAASTPRAACSWSTTRRSGCSAWTDDVGSAARRRTSGCPPALVAAAARRDRRARRRSTLAGDRVLVVSQAPAQLGGPRRRHGGDPARPHRAAGGDRRARLGPRPRRVAAGADPRGRQPAAHRGVPDRAGPRRGRRRVRHRRSSRSPSSSPTRSSARSATRSSPRCCSARPPQAAERGVDLTDRPATAGVDRPARRAARPGDHPRQPARQRARRRRRVATPRRVRRAVSSPTTTLVTSRSATAGRASRTRSRAQVFERGWSTKRRGRGRPRPRPGPGRAGRPPLRRASRRRPRPTLGGARVRRARSGRRRCAMTRPGARRRGRGARGRGARGVRRAGRRASRSPASPAPAATAAPAPRQRPRVDLVLLDMHLPDVHGLELLQRLRADGHLLRRDRGDVRARPRGGAARGRPGRRALPAQAVHVRGVPRQARAVRRRTAPSSLAADEDAGQDEVDRLLGPLRADRRPRLPKG